MKNAFTLVAVETGKYVAGLAVAGACVYTSFGIVGREITHQHHVHLHAPSTKMPDGWKSFEMDDLPVETKPQPLLYQEPQW